MALNPEFRAKIQTGEIFEALSIAMSEAIELEVTTWIDSADLDQITIAQSLSGNRLHTRLNLLDGTVNHEIDLKLIDNPAYSELQRWHIEQVNRRQDSFIENLTSLEKMRNIFLSQNPLSDQ